MSNAHIPKTGKRSCVVTLVEDLIIKWLSHTTFSSIAINIIIDIAVIVRIVIGSCTQVSRFCNIVTISAPIIV